MVRLTMPTGVKYSWDFAIFDWYLNLAEACG